MPPPRQPSRARGRRSRSHRRGSQVGSRSVGPWRWKRPCETFVESSGSCPIEIQDRFSGPKDTVVQGFPRRKRAGRLEEVIARAPEEKDVCLKSTLRSMLQWRSCRKESTFCKRSGMLCWQQPPPVLPRPAPVWMGDGPPSLDNIPPLPSTNVQDVEHWLNCRNCEMRNALEYGYPGTAARCGTLAAMLANLSQDVPMIARSNLMGVDQRGRYQEEVRRRARRSVTRNSRYGLRGCRIGEASNPDPTRGCF